jgi:transposase-like protein
MPWKVTDVVEERTRFVLEYDSEEYTMAELCRIYGIARKTGYDWVESGIRRGIWVDYRITVMEPVIIRIRRIQRSRSRFCI